MAKHGGGILSEPNAQVDPTIRGDGPVKEISEPRAILGGSIGSFASSHCSAIMFIQGGHVLTVRAPASVNLREVMEQAKAQLAKPGSSPNSFAVFPEGVELKVV